MAVNLMQDAFSWEPTKPKPAASSGFSYGGPQEGQVESPFTATPPMKDVDTSAMGSAAAPFSTPPWSMGNPRAVGFGQTPAAARRTSVPGFQPSAGGATTPDFSSAVQELQSLTDPQQIAMKRDQLARTLFDSLSKGGNEVKWDGDQLIINGRPYVVAGGGTSGGAESRMYAGGSATFKENGGGYMPQTTPDQVAEVLRQNGMGGASINDIVAMLQARGYGPDVLAAAEEELNNMGWSLQEHAEGFQGRTGSDLTRGRIYDPQGRGYDIFDPREGANWWESTLTDGQWTARQAPGLYDAPTPSAATGFSYQNTTPFASGARTTSLGSGETQVEMAAMPPSTPSPGPNFVPYNGGWVPADHPLAQMAGGQPGATGPWAPGRGPTYTPGEIGFGDIPNFDYQTLFNQLTEEGATDVQLRQLIERIMANPESLDERTVEMMKAKSKQELSEMQALDDEDLRLFGEASGLSDSPWLRSERAMSRTGRDRALVESNRDIDIDAAATRSGDRRAAAQLGLSYQAGRAGQRQAAASLATNATLQRAALTGDRMALRENLKQEAARLGQSADQVMSNWLSGIRDDLTRRYGIDVAANLDMRKLDQQSQEFKEELIFRYAQLQQLDRQFGAGYGLDVARLQHQMDQDYWNRSTGGGGTGFSYGS